jgi:ribosome-binding protein aMBF1 (putative translation factor)
MSKANKTWELIRNHVPSKEAHPDYDDKTLDSLLQNTDPLDPEEPSWVKKARYTRDNRQMLRLSARLAILILSSLKETNMTKQELATSLNKTNEEVESYLHGEHNFDLKTICDLERVLGKQLIKINIDF